MAILPIDLQTLYAQLDKIGKAQVTQQVAAQAARDAEKIINRKKAQLKATTVQTTESSEAVTHIVQDHQSDATSGSASFLHSKHHKDETESVYDESSAPAEVIHDPALGNNIDISG